MPQFNGPNGVITASGQLASVLERDWRYEKIDHSDPTPEPEEAAKTKTPVVKKEG